ncbi:hypothetical protein BJV82DRAFT_239350 [Fennellomyces sp. T-0311]|nr:hypothetical protein BJV82DRAFT_239350 [Fennellomyces sp. T-0311]
MASVQDGNEQLLEWWDQVSQLEDMLDAVNVSIAQDSSDEDDSSIGTPEAQEPQWKLSVVNGRVRLESTIKNFQELAMYNQASIRYLSPLAGLLQRESIRFEGICASVAIASFGLVLRYSPPKPRQHQIRQLPYKVDYRNEIDHLVRLYLTRYNECVGLLHVPTFMKYYHRLKDPMDSPITLGICVDAIAYFYPQLEHSPLEKRQMAEFFYTRCRDMLLDMFDQPSRRLEAIMTTNLLMQYLQDVMMEYTEARRLVTIAKLVCEDIQANHLYSLTPLERVLFDRHYMSLHVWQSLIFIFLEGKFDFSGVPDVPVTLLDQEPEMVVVYLNMWKAIARLLGCPYITILMKQITHAVHGEPYELSLDMIMQFEPMMREWWAGLLPDFQICNDPFSSTAYMAVEEVTSSIVLMPLAVLHGLSALLHSSLLKPRLLTVDDQLTEDMIDILRQKAISVTLISVKMLVYVLKRNLEIDLEALPGKVCRITFFCVCYFDL